MFHEIIYLCSFLQLGCHHFSLVAFSRWAGLRRKAMYWRHIKMLKLWSRRGTYMEKNSYGSILRRTLDIPFSLVSKNKGNPCFSRHLTVCLMVYSISVGFVEVSWEYAHFFFLWKGENFMVSVWTLKLEKYYCLFSYILCFMLVYID